MARYITYKRWKIEALTFVDDMVSFFREEVAPAYRSLPGCLGAGLERVEGSDSFIASQHWRDEETAARSLETPEGIAWYAANHAILHRWMEMLTLEEEWAATELVSAR